MREYGQIQCSFWTDPDVRELSDQAKLLATYLITGPHSNGIGCYRLPIGYVMADFGWDSEMVSEGFRELFRKGFCTRCEATDFVLIPKFLAWNPIANANVAKARQREFELVPKKSRVYNELAKSALAYGAHWRNPFETILKRYAEQDPEPDPTQNQNQTLPRTRPDPTRKSAPSANALRADDDAQGPPDDPVDPDDPIAATLPLVDGSDHPIRHSQVAAWAAAYPAVQVPQALLRMRAWCEANPQRRKTRRGIDRAVVAWLSRDQDRGGGGPPNGGGRANGAVSNAGAAEEAKRRFRERQPATEEGCYAGE